MSSSSFHVLITEFVGGAPHNQHEADYEGVLELGRQINDRERVFEPTVLGPDRIRLVIAEMGEDTISRRQAEVRALPGSRVEVRNISTQAVLYLGDRRTLPPGQSTVEFLNVAIRVGHHRLIRIDAVDPDDDSLQSLPEATLAPGSSLQSRSRLERPGLVGGERGGVEGEIDAILGRLRLAVDALQADAGNPEYYDLIARSIVEIVGLDVGSVLFFDGSGGWRVQSCHIGSKVAVRHGFTPSQRILSQVLARKRTFFYKDGDELTSSGASLAHIERVVAAPILGKDQQVVGALYGERRRGPRIGFPLAISKADALMVELLAMGVAGGLERIKLEKEKAQALVRFEQFFTKDLAEKLIQTPALMDGRDCEITTLFCDIRGFSRESEHLGPLKTVEWVRSVMDALSDCVQTYNGVLVDFIGDELIAMWGAPDRQENHAELACQAARAMIESLPELCRYWDVHLVKPMSLGIGLNSGMAHVGNTGSSRRLKYGPLGSSVNLASRVQNLTKHLRSQLLLTGETLKQAGSIPLVRRVGAFEVVNISETVQIYEILVPQHADLTNHGSGRLDPIQIDRLINDYAEALRLYEKANFRDSVRRLNEILTRFENDGPTLFLLGEAIRHLNADTDSVNFNPVFKMNQK